MSDTGYSPTKWEFDKEVTRVFDDMLERSIPAYNTMRFLVAKLAAQHVSPGTSVVDLGCSNGRALHDVMEQTIEPVAYIGAEISQPMLAAARERFHGQEDVKIVDHDLRLGFPPAPVPVSVTLSILTLMFVPINCRAGLLREIYARTSQGGCLIVVEKVLGDTADIDSVYVTTYHETKVMAGYDADDVERKRLALEGVLVPLTARWNEDQIHRAGFTQVDCFWRWANFAGWIAVK